MVFDDAWKDGWCLREECVLKVTPHAKTPRTEIVSYIGADGSFPLTIQAKAFVSALAVLRIDPDPSLLDQ